MADIIDADGHVVEEESFVRAFLGRWPDEIRMREVDGELAGFEVEGRVFPEEGAGRGCPAAHALAPGADPSTPQSVLADVRRDRIDRMVLFPTLAMFGFSMQGAALSDGFSRLYNEWLADFCARSDGPLLGAAMLPLAHPERAIEVMKEARRLGHVCAILPPALGRWNLDDARFDSVYAAAEQLDLALCVHGAPGIHLPKIGVDRFTNYIQVHCISFPFDQMTAMTALVSGGVLDRHPSLRVAFLESGVGWVPYFVDRLHEHYQKRGDWIPNGWQHDPREYVERGQLFVACEPEEPILPGVIATLGDEFIVYASDYPHWDGDWPESTRPLRERADISDASRARILGGNAARLFGLEG